MRGETHPVPAGFPPLCGISCRRSIAPHARGCWWRRPPFSPPANDTGDAKKQNFEWLAWVVIGMGVVGVAVAVFFDRRGIKKANKTENAPEQSTEKNDTEA